MNSQEQSIIDEFTKYQSDLKSWGKFVDSNLKTDILKDFISDHKIKIEPRSRLKEDNSYLSKALYRSKQYPNPIVNIEDKIGTRIVVLKSSDIAEITGRILRNPLWIAKLDKDIQEEIEKSPTVFVYQSAHIIVKPTEEDEAFTSEIKPILTCEIQIRTLLQHAFAEVSHDSTYKGPYKNDKEIIRKLAKSMALMEATDDYFCEIFSLMLDKQRYYSKYLEGLTSVFKKFMPDFIPAENDNYLTYLIFELLEKRNVELTEIEEFTIKHTGDLSTSIKPKNGLLFQQPVILLILYYFFNNEPFLRSEWPLNQEALKSIFKATNTSFEAY